MGEMINPAGEAPKPEQPRQLEQTAARTALFQELVARKDRLQNVALGILARTGSTSASYSDDLTDEQLSPAIPLGKLEGGGTDDRSFAFARVFVAYEKQSVGGGFLKPTEHEPVRTGEISSFGVRLIAAHEDGSDAATISHAYWHMANDYNTEELGRIESCLKDITIALGTTEPVILDE